MAKRLHEISKTYGLTNKEVVVILAQHGFKLRAHQFTPITEAQEKILTKHVTESNKKTPAPLESIGGVRLHNVASALGISCKEASELFKQAGTHIDSNQFRTISRAEVIALKKHISHLFGRSVRNL